VEMSVEVIKALRDERGAQLGPRPAGGQRRARGLEGGAKKFRPDVARAQDFEAQLAAACPKGIDIYFENVAGRVLRAVIPLFNFWARMPVCGLISQYNMTELPAGPDHLPLLMRSVLTNRLHIRGFIVRDFADQQADFMRDLGQWVRDGRVKYREHRVKGLENAPETLIGLLKGANFGKVVVEVSEEPTKIR